MNTSHTLSEPSETEIQHAAYYLWVESGRAPGHDLENWLAAREMLRHRSPVSIRPPTKSRKANLSSKTNISKN